jgi:dihydrolipoamide dehydrogenase
LGRPKSLDPSRLIRAVTTWPEAAAVGMTESAAKKAGYDVIVGNIPYGVNASAMIRLDTGGAVKVVAESGRRRLLGVHIVGPRASELIGEAALALEMEAVLEDLIDGVRYHPSAAESQTDAAREALGRGLYVLR